MKITGAWSIGLWSIAPCLALLLPGSEPAWKKPIPSWTEQDARQVLADSPWSKIALGGVTRPEGEDQRRESGSMGQPNGVGYQGLEDSKARPSLPELLSGKESPARAPISRAIQLRIRWESALPIRAAELKARTAGVATPSENGYYIAVYGVPGAYFGDPKRLGDPLKSSAILKREGKKDVKPASVEVLQLEEGAAVLYLFPFSANITKEDGVVTFAARIGRIQVSQLFRLEEMQLQGKLEL